MNFLCRCMCTVQPEKETLEEKPFILPTDSPVSAPTLGISIGFGDPRVSILLNVIMWASLQHSFLILTFNVPF